MTPGHKVFIPHYVGPDGSGFDRDAREALPIAFADRTSAEAWVKFREAFEQRHVSWSVMEFELHASVRQ